VKTVALLETNVPFQHHSVRLSSSKDAGYMDSHHGNSQSALFFRLYYTAELRYFSFA